MGFSPRVGSREAGGCTTSIQLPQSSCSTGQAGPFLGFCSFSQVLFLGLYSPRLVPCPVQGRTGSASSSSGHFSRGKLGQMPPAAWYLHQAALRTPPGLHPGPPGRSLAPSLAPPTCSQTTSLRRKQQEAQPRAHTSQKLPPSLQTTSLGGCDPFLASPRETGVTPKQQSQARENCS